ncbi:Insecticidal toxin complex protein [Mangrovimonas sp. DI 80]|nr:Insecticidal toxin complex protein [Mangrovimonas sp. DI 80]
MLQKTFNYCLIILFLVLGNTVLAKEWSCIKDYEKITGNDSLAPSDWLTADRHHNTITWQRANAFNLKHNLSKEYETIRERTDFYKWLYEALDAKGHEVVWPKMAHFISNKLRLTKAFPYKIFMKKDIEKYAYLGSEAAFYGAFETLGKLYFSEDICKGKEALVWDEQILQQEQYVWLEEIYENVDPSTLKTIERMAEGKGFYAMVVPRQIRFKGDILLEEKRYEYALHTLREYCKVYYP